MRYNVHMTMNATALRRNLFAALEKALGGETVEIEYKGARIRLAVERPGSKLARAKRQNTLLVDPRSIVHSDPELLKELEAEWERDWKML
jgi:hypothetical protein